MYVRRSLKTPQDKKYEDHVLENNVSLAHSQSITQLSKQNTKTPQNKKCTKHRACKAERRVQSTEHRRQSADCREQCAKRRAQSAERRAQSAEHRAHGAERRAQMAERRVQSAAKISLDIKNKKWFETLIRSKVFLKNEKNGRPWAQKTFLI